MTILVSLPAPRWMFWLNTEPLILSGQEMCKRISNKYLHSASHVSSQFVKSIDIAIIKANKNAFKMDRHFAKSCRSYSTHS